MQSITESLNKQQAQAVTAEPKSALILAGAGSGKTRVLTSRIAYLLQQNMAHPSEILAVTFTNNRHGVRLPAHHRPAPGTKTASLNHRKNFFCSRRPQRRGFSAFLSRPQRQTSLRGLAAGTALHYGGTS